MTRQAFCRVLLAIAAIVLLSGHSLPISRAIAQGLSDIWTWALSSPGGLGSCQPLTGCENVRIASLAAYNGQLLAGTENANQGAEIGQYDGTAWTKRIQGGFGDAQNTSIAAMAPYGSQLYAGTQGTDSGAELWAYNSITWTRALTGGFDQSRLPSDPKNVAATALTSFNSKLYIGTRYDYDGAEIWAYNGITATQVVSAGLANTDNVAVLSLAVFNNKLYAGTLTRSGGGELWRSSNGTDWERVVANASAGFADPSNVGISSLAVLSGTLYAGTQNLSVDGTGADIWRSSDGTNWTLALGNGFGNAALYKVNTLLPYQGMLYAAVSSAQAQAEIWAYDGQTWQRALSSAPQANGQAHSFSEARSLAVLNNLLYLGTSQVSIGSTASGPEVWRTGGPAAATPTATATTLTPTRTATATATASSTATPPPSATSTRTATQTPTWTATATPTATRTATASMTATSTQTVAPTGTTTRTGTATPSVTGTTTVAATATLTATASATPTITTTPTATVAPRYLIFLPLIMR